MKENADIIISIIGALGLREAIAFAIKWYKDNSDQAKSASQVKQSQLETEIQGLRAKVDLIQLQLSQTQQRNVKLETAMTLSLQFIERTSPESRDIVEDIKILLQS